MKPRTSDLMVDRIASDAALQDRLKSDPVGVLREVSQEITTKTPRVMEADVWIYRMIVLALGLVVVSSVVGIFYLSVKMGEDAFIPATITALSSGALGALAGILTPRS